jgi:hypothetical protein
VSVAVRRVLRAALAPLAAVATLLGGGLASADAVDPLVLEDLRVGGGEDTWHADDDFLITWTPPPLPASELPIAATLYRIRDAEGNVVVGERRVLRRLPPLNHIHVPPTPGRYTADVWLEATDGRRGPEASVTLRFDDARPGSVRPTAPDGWIPGGTPTLARVGHPAEPLPLSGIRGYAVSVDQDPDGIPCAALDRCTETETDLHGGVSGDTISLGVLPEGTSYVHTLAVSGSGKRSASVGTAALRIDATLPRVALSGVPQGWAAGPVRLTATATDALSGMAPEGPGGPFTAIAVDDLVPTIAAGGSVTATVSGEGVHTVTFYGRDAAGNVPGHDRPPPTALVRIDEESPGVSFARTRDAAEPERIDATVSDLLSGADPRRGSIGLRPLGSRQRFEPLPTVVEDNRLSAHWDSDSFPRGDYEFLATGYDLAGNSASTSRRSDGARMVLRNPLKTETRLTIGFGRPERHRLTAGYSRAAPFGGRLTTGSGVPLSGETIEVLERLGGGTRATTVRTGDDGRFLVRLPAGPSRDIEARFIGSPTLTRAPATGLRLGVLGGVWLHTSAPSARVGGRPVVFSGRVGRLGATIPPNGLPVALQFRLPGLPWTGFRTVYTDSRGRFRYPYEFSDDDSRGARFQFRASVPAQNNWPYEPAGSRPVTVTGR